jgi:hypothetical protein
MAEASRSRQRKARHIDQKAHDPPNLKTLAPEQPPEYVTVTNRPNQVATVHLVNCSYLGPAPLMQTVSADRMAFADLDPLRGDLLTPS